MKTFYIELFNSKSGISTTKEKQANGLGELLEEIDKTQMSKMEYQVFSGKPYTFENLEYTHHTESFYR